MYEAVPSVEPSFVSTDAPSSFANPKSRIFTVPSAVTNRLAGFTSRCTIPFPCACASPAAA